MSLCSPMPIPGILLLGLTVHHPGEVGSLLELITAIGCQVMRVYSKKKFSVMIKRVDSGVKVLESKSKFYHSRLCDLGRCS